MFSDLNQAEIGEIGGVNFKLIDRYYCQWPTGANGKDQLNMPPLALQGVPEYFGHFVLPSSAQASSQA